MADYFVKFDLRQAMPKYKRKLRRIYSKSSCIKRAVLCQITICKDDDQCVPAEKEQIWKVPSICLALTSKLATTVIDLHRDIHKYGWVSNDGSTSLISLLVIKDIFSLLWM